MRTSVRDRGASRVVARAVVVPVAILAALAGCSSGESTSGSDGESSGGGESGVAGQEMPARADEQVPGGHLPDGGAANGSAADSDRSQTTPGTANRPVVAIRAVIRKGEISLVTQEMNRARVEIEDMLGRHGGYLASEDTSNDRTGRPERSVLVLRVPEPAFDEVMTGLGTIGRTTDADRRSEDVTTQVIDVDSRVTTQEASLARLRRFLDQATDVDDMIRVEAEIAERQAELESLKAQQKYLRDNTAMSTITVRLSTPVAPPPQPAEEERGFLAGLEDGWHALRLLLVGAATIAGALLPFTVAISLVGVPLWLLVRAARRRRPAAPPATPEAS